MPHPSLQFHSKIHSAEGQRENSQLERSDERLAVDKTGVEWMWEIDDLHRFPSVRDGNW